MNDTAEQNLRRALSELAESRPSAAEARLRALDYHPRAVRVRWPAAGLGAILVAAAAATAAVLLSSAAAPYAFAGWAAVPAAATHSSVAVATTACNSINPSQGPLTGTPVLTEQRGKYTAAVYVKSSIGWYNVCVSDGSTADTSVSGGAGVLTDSAAPGPDQLGMPAGAETNAPGFAGSTAEPTGQVPMFWAEMTAAQRALAQSSGNEHDVVGLAGEDVRSVTFNFDHGVTVDATVENGWYFAWWPGGALPNSVQITTESGTTATSPVPGTASWSRACWKPGSQQGENSSTSSCGVFATGERPSAVRRRRAYREAHAHTSTGGAARSTH